MRTPTLPLSAVLVLLLFLTGCGGGKKASEAEVLSKTDALQGLVNLATQDPLKARPSAMLGIFTTAFLSLQDMTSSDSAVRGIGALVLLIEKEDIAMDEIFALLQELGTALQVDVPDTLNRSDDRAKTLNAYFESLKNVGERSKKKRDELESLGKSLDQERKTQREVVTGIERQVNTAIRAQDYATAGGLQQRFTQEQTKLAELESRIDRLRQTLSLYQKLLEIAEKRVQAIEQNREILIAGLKVVDLPGVEELDILEQKNRRDLISPFGEL
ncbi:MAG: hypothetical protein AAB489_03235 [Patescibacteria group bacterium]